MFINRFFYFSLILLTAFPVFFSELVLSQDYIAEEGLSAKDLFKAGNFGAALKEFDRMLEKDSENMDIKYKIGQCYLYINDDKSKAIPYLEEVTSQNKYDKEALYELGRAYHLNLQFDKAIEYYKKYLAQLGTKIQNAERQIEMCNNGKKLIQTPLNVTFGNLGSNINSPYPDYSPFIPEDESYLVFTSRRKGNRGGLMDYDGFFTSDVYMSSVKGGLFDNAQNISIINTEADEEAAGISPDGNNILVFVDDVYQNIFGNIYISLKKGKSFQPLISIGENVNTSTNLETAASLTPNNKLLYFASDRVGGYGGTDLYVSKRLPDGEWGLPLNLGPEINTQYNEDYPSISYDGKTLYFSSEGHTSMGGYDLFVSEYDTLSAKWEMPSNIGYPVNTPDDNMNISFSSTWDNDAETAHNKYAYLAAYRKEGFGDLDIYRVTFNKVEERLTVIRGVIIAKIPADNSTYKTFHHYEKDSMKISVPDECFPWFDESWRLVKEEKTKINPGFELQTNLYFTKDGKEKIFSSKKYPKEKADGYEFIKIKTTQIKIPNYILPKAVYKETPLTDAIVYITGKSTGEELTYLPSKTGNYVIILPPGKYDIKVEAPGFKPTSHEITIYDKISYVPEIIKDFIFEPEK